MHLTGSKAFNRLEQEVLQWIAARTGDETVRRQIEAALFVSREFTGVGCFTELAVPDHVVDEIGPILTGGPLHGPYIHSPWLEYGALTLVFLDDGVIDLLEMAAYGQRFPEDMDEYTLLHWDDSKKS